MPPPLHIEVISCLLVHPRYTTQAPPSERIELASKAIGFLRNTLTILGPINAGLSEAFTFPGHTQRSARRNRNNYESDPHYSSSDSEDRPEKLNGVIANSGRIRNCAKDFWQVVGWVFNCGSKFPRRWEHWKLWLSYMIDVLDADWNERECLDAENVNNQEGPSAQIKKEMNLGTLQKEQMLQNCLLLQYLSGVRNRGSQLSRVIRAVFADASPESLKEFPEVFPNETKERMPTGQKRKRGGGPGGYYDDDNVIPSEFPEATDHILGAVEEVEGIEHDHIDPFLGGADCFALRQRLITLLSRVAHFMPDRFVDISQLYDAIDKCVSGLPVPAFSLFIAPPYRTYLLTEVYISLSQLHLLRLLPRDAPEPRSVQKGRGDELTQLTLEKCMLPFPAMQAYVGDNAKVSILVENLLRLFLKSCKWKYTPSFVAAIERGVTARESKCKGGRGRKDSSVKEKDTDDLVWLRASGERLRLLGQFIEQKRRND